MVGGGAYARDKNTSARLCAKNAGGAYARGGAYLRDTTVIAFMNGIIAPHFDSCNYQPFTRAINPKLHSKPCCYLYK